jgi:hypothetical protein
VRFSTALGPFLAAFGGVLALHPVYAVKREMVPTDLEATAPLVEYRPIPGWVGISSIGAGGVAYLRGRSRRNERPKR